jgi:hypothetical protein
MDGPQRNDYSSHFLKQLIEKVNEKVGGNFFIDSVIMLHILENAPDLDLDECADAVSKLAVYIKDGKTCR